MALNFNPWGALPLTVCVSMNWLISVFRDKFGHPVATLGWRDSPSLKEKKDFILPPLQYSNDSESLLDSLGFLGLGKVALSTTAVSAPSLHHANYRWQSASPTASFLAIVGGTNCCKQLQVLSLDGFDNWTSRRPQFRQPEVNQWRRYNPLSLFVILWTIPVAQQVLWSLVGTISRELGVPPDLLATEY